MSTQRIKNGLLVEIDLGDGTSAFGRVLSKAELGFYDFRKVQGKDVDFDQVYHSPILFTISVMNYAIKQGRWKVVDSRPLEPSLEQVRYYYMQDIISGKYSIYNANDGSTRPANPGEETGLEKAAVWDPEHVEERLRNYFSDKEGK